MKKETIILTILLFLSVSCSFGLQMVPTATRLPTEIPAVNTPEPAETKAPTSENTAEPTPELTSTLAEIPPTPTESGLFIQPKGEPLETWQGIPIMPGALFGDYSAEEAYVFSIDASRDEIETYYTIELPKLGWEPFAAGDSEAGTVLLMFMGEKGTLTITILTVGAEEGLYNVMLLIP